MSKDSTRAKSSKQEKRIAKAIGGRQVVGSGSTPFLKGDVIAGDLFIEAKTKMNPSQSVTEDNLMEDLYKSREALRAVIDAIGGVDHDPLGLESAEIYRIRELIKEAY